MVQRELKNDELVELLQNNGHIFEPELQDLCQQKSLDTKVTEPKIVIVGWAGKPKGIFQVLWETGCIDHTQQKKYKMNPGKNNVDADGNITEEFQLFHLEGLMANHIDFKQEVSDLEALANDMSTEDCKISVVFTPKYHCEIAGEGIKNSWGFQKKLY